MMEKIIEILRNFGIFDYYLPFLLTFSIFYALLTKTKIFGEGAKKINAAIALVAALYITIFTPAGITISNFLANFFGFASIIFLTLLMFGGVLWISLKSVVGKERLEIKHLDVLIAIVACLLAISILSWSGALKIFGVKEVKWEKIDLEATLFTLAFIGVFVGLIAWMMKGKPEAKPT